MQDKHDSKSKNTFEKIVSGMDDRQYTALRTALELGQWPTGKRLTSDEQDMALQILIVYEHQHLPENQRTGYMPDQCKKHQRSETREDKESILRFRS